MLLYQPSPSEITAATIRAKFRNPSLAAKIIKAASILQDINRNFECIDGWRVRSQSHDDTWHAVSSAGCTCTDYRIHAPNCTGNYYCKHLIAFYGYRRMLGNELNRRLVGNLKFANERKRAEQWPGSLLAVTDSKRPRVVAYDSYHRFPRHVCYVRLDATDRLVPCDVDDYLAFAEWVPTAPKFQIEQPEPAMEEAAPEWSPEWTHGDFKHWMNTGNTPAMRTTF